MWFCMCYILRFIEVSDWIRHFLRPSHEGFTYRLEGIPDTRLRSSSIINELFEWLRFLRQMKNRQKDLWKQKSQRKIISKFPEERLGVLKNNVYEEIKATQLCLVLDVMITTSKFKRLKFGKFNESHFIIYDKRMSIHFHNDFFSPIPRAPDLTLFDLMIRNFFFY